MLEEIPSRVRGLLEGFIRERLTGETFSNYWGRTHVNGTKATPEQFHIEAQRPGELVTAEKKAFLFPEETHFFYCKYDLPFTLMVSTPPRVTRPGKFNDIFSSSFLRTLLGGVGSQM